MEYIAGIAIGLILGAGAAVGILHLLGKNALVAARAQADQLKTNSLSEAQNKAKEIELTARQEQIKRKEQFERETESARNEMKAHEIRLSKREDTLDRKLDTLSVKE